MADGRDTPYVTQALDGGVLTVHLGKAPAHTLSLGMIRALQDVWATAASDPSVRVIVLSGAGRIFCAGHDMKEIQQRRSDPDDGRAYVETLLTECSAMMLSLARLPQPTLAMVDGVATAGGLQLMCSCDLVFASTAARFCLPGVTNGGFCSTPAVAAGRKILPGHVMEMSLSGDMFDVGWAQQVGLVNRTFAPDALNAETDAFAKTLAGRHAPAIHLGKTSLYKQLGEDLEAAYKVATPAMIEHFMDPHRVQKDKTRY